MPPTQEGSQGPALRVGAAVLPAQRTGGSETGVGRGSEAALACGRSSSSRPQQGVHTCSLAPRQ